jgi:hypothetical protein
LSGFVVFTAIKNPAGTNVFKLPRGDSAAAMPRLYGGNYEAVARTSDSKWIKIYLNKAYGWVLVANIDFNYGDPSKLPIADK